MPILLHKLRIQCCIHHVLQRSNIINLHTFNISNIHIISIYINNTLKEELNLFSINLIISYKIYISHKHTNIYVQDINNTLEISALFIKLHFHSAYYFVSLFMFLISAHRSLKITQSIKTIIIICMKVNKRIN